MKMTKPLVVKFSHVFTIVEFKDEQVVVGVEIWLRENS